MMKRLDSLEKQFRFLATPNVILVLIAAQLITYGAILTGRLDYSSLLLNPNGVFNGEWWRTISFLIAPPYIAANPLDAVFLAFYWYILWMMSSAIESIWGIFKFNLYLLSGTVFTVVGALLGQLISPNALIEVSIVMISMSIFFAFATTHPNVEFLVMFILPVKVKWLAWLAGIILAMNFLGGPLMGHRLAILGTVMNYFLFFRADIVHALKSRERRIKFESQNRKLAEEALHTCTVCGVTDQSDPDRDFRYKTVGKDAVCICLQCRETAHSKA